MGTPTGAARAGAAAPVEGQWWGRRAGGAATRGDRVGQCLRMGPVVRSCAGAVVGELQPVGSPPRISCGGTAFHGKDPREAGAESAYGGVAETKCYGLTAAPTSYSPVVPSEGGCRRR